MASSPLQETWRRLEAFGWARCSDEPPCWHHPYADLNDPFTTEQALEYSAGRQARLRMCAEGTGPDWSGYPNEYDTARLSAAEIALRAVEACERQGFESAMAEAGRRAVRKHADALRRLADG